MFSVGYIVGVATVLCLAAGVDDGLGLGVAIALAIGVLAILAIADINNELPRV